ncbi:FecR domain-containing protein [Niabella sp.]|uniref:FecR family protein n=1 Tax=Niabella sp. TaxID=1962976 RepID=UPI002629E42A|nr:FecR domain-containing protein [Niabella sp.]
MKEIRNEIDPDEKKLLQQWVGADFHNRLLYEELTDPVQLDRLVQTTYSSGLKIAQKIRAAGVPLLPAATGRRVIYRYWAVAACLVLVAGLFALYYSSIKAPQHPALTKNKDIPAPAFTQPVVTLAGGETIRTAALQTDTLLLSGGVRLIKGKDGSIVYKSTGKASQAGALQYNTLYNPKGSRVSSLVLSDGTRIWLNAGSSVTYPVAFAGPERRIDINGEAYLEVFHDASRPFYVKKGSHMVKVLGTKFNVSAYDNEASIKTALLEGSVQVTNGARMVKLVPGQEARSVPGGFEVVKADLDKVLAWRSDFFQFDAYSFPELMRQLERWYDVAIVYNSAEVADVRLSGAMNRATSIQGLIKILEYSGLHCSLLADKKLIVSKK